MDQNTGLVIDDQVVAVNDAIALLRDAVDEYRQAEEAAADPSLVAFLQAGLAEREILLADLEAAVREMGELPEGRGTAAGAAQQLVGLVKAAVADDATVAAAGDLAAAERRRAEQLAGIATDGLPAGTVALLARFQKVSGDAAARIEALVGGLG